MSETKHTSGKWKVERTSHIDGDFQARILCESSERTSHESNYEKPQIYIIIGEPSKRNGITNIYSEANAKLIAAAPDLLETLQNMMSIKALIQYPDDVKGEHRGEAEAIQSLINQAELAIKKATS